MKKLTILLYFIIITTFASANDIINYYSKDTQTIATDSIDEYRFGINKKAVANVDKSVLSTGKWAKVRVKTSGMKKLTKSALAQMGFSDINKISVYGNGGKALPYSNKEERISDLAKLPIYKLDDGILFYAQGVETWSYSKDTYTCNIHLDDLYSYYFITDGQEPSDKPEQYTFSAEPNQFLTTYDFYIHHELRQTNLIKSGREWYGEKITPTSNKVKLSFDIPDRPDGYNNVNIQTRVIGHSGDKINYKINYNGVEAIQGSINGLSNPSSNTAEYARAVKKSTDIIVDDSKSNDVEILMNFSASNDIGWLDYITILSTAKLSMQNKDELLFRNALNNTKSNKATEFAISNSKREIEVWDVTDCTSPISISVQYNDNTTKIVVENGTVKEFIAFNPKGDFEAPTYVGEVHNQNLHGYNSANYIIVYYKDFKEQAERLADLHRQYSNLSVITAECEEIYNEFASGKREPAAIRDFVKYIYDKDKSYETGLRYLLLFGSGSYDNIIIGENNEQNIIPTYQSSESLYQSQSYVTDDFFGWLDDNEGASDTYARVDIGIGRFPVRNAEQAKIAVDKTETYLTKLDNGNWKTKVVFVADDGDSNEHIGYAEKNASKIEELYTKLNVERIYLETYTPITTSTGVEYSLAKDQFFESINNGSLVINYVGHGGYSALTDEHLFNQSYIKTWTNSNKLPFFITATCDFAPFDNLNKISAGEESFLYPYGGFIGLLTTTRLVYGDSNYRINNKFYDLLFEKDQNGHRYTIGDATKYAKIETGSLINSLKYILIGDPAIKLAYNEEYDIKTDYINNEEFENIVDPISALSKNTIIGSIRDANGNIDTQFNGRIAITLYDKKNKNKTNGTKSEIFEFEEYSSKLYSGITNVSNGKFEINFQLSKDINFEQGYGRISYYAYSDDGKEAIGASNNILIGGINGNSADDENGPNITAWINYPEFNNGDITGASPIIFAKISDDSGINTSGLGVGHNISLVINNDRNNAINLNNYFKYDENSYTDGTLQYQLNALQNGKYTIKIKAWDNINNSNTIDLNFEVNQNSKISFGEAEIYPNPLTINNKTLKLRFSHDEIGSSLNITLKLYSFNGQLIAMKKLTSISNTQMCIIELSDEMPIFATLPKGFYILETEVQSDARKGSFTKKIIINEQ